MGIIICDSVAEEHCSQNHEITYVMTIRLFLEKNISKLGGCRNKETKCSLLNNTRRTIECLKYSLLVYESLRK